MLLLDGLKDYFVFILDFLENVTVGWFKRLFCIYLGFSQK